MKTAGTSYLEALRVVAIHEPELFRDLCRFARGRFADDKATYHVHATLDTVPPPEDVRDDRRLQNVYLDCWDDVPLGSGFTQPGRQILHCTFGSVLMDHKWGEAVRSCLQEHRDTYAELLAVHFSKHLDALGAGGR